MESGMIRLRTYRQVWRLERVIYQVERVRLPFPVTFRQIGIFVFALLLMVPVSRLPGLNRLPGLVIFGLVPALAAWYLTSQTLDGKPPHRWLLSMLLFGLSPKRLNRFSAMPDGGRVRFTSRRRRRK